ncbi:MAG: CapA family protein [Lachnospiraceae bacterium]
MKKNKTETKEKKGNFGRKFRKSSRSGKQGFLKRKLRTISHDISNGSIIKKISWKYIFVTVLVFIIVIESAVVVRKIVNTQKKIDNIKKTTETITKASTETVGTTAKKIPTKSVTLSFVGDIMCHRRQLEDAYDYTNGTYDFSKTFEDVKPYLKKADLTIGNLETVFGGSQLGYTGYPMFNTPDSLAKVLKDIGFDVLTTSNNHAFDQGASGVRRTIDILDKAKISHVGSYKNEKDKDKILIRRVNGWRIAFVSFTYGVNVNTPEAKKHFNYLTEKEIKSQMAKARKKKADCIIVLPHWGDEYSTVASEQQRNLAELFIKEGADIIVGSHPHVLQHMKTKETTDKNGKKKKVFIAYSMGNFSSNQVREYTLDEAIITLKLRMKESGLVIENISSRPVYMVKPFHFSSFNHYQLIDIYSYKEEYEKDSTGKNQYLYNTLLKAEKEINTILKGN